MSEGGRVVQRVGGRRGANRCAMWGKKKSCASVLTLSSRAPTVSKRETSQAVSAL